MLAAKEVTGIPVFEFTGTDAWAAPKDVYFDAFGNNASNANATAIHASPLNLAANSGLNALDTVTVTFASPLRTIDFLLVSGIPVQTITGLTALAYMRLLDANGAEITDASLSFATKHYTYDGTTGVLTCSFPFSDSEAVRVPNCWVAMRPTKSIGGFKMYMLNTGNLPSSLSHLPLGSSSTPGAPFVGLYAIHPYRNPYTMDMQGIGDMPESELAQPSPRKLSPGIIALIVILVLAVLSVTVFGVMKYRKHR